MPRYPAVGHMIGSADRVRTSGSINAESVIRQTPMTVRQWWAIMICVSVNAIDGFDILAISFAAPGFSAEWGINRAQLGIVLSMELIGMAAGSALFGGAADRWGRRRVLLIALGTVSISMLACAFARDLVELSIFRLISGLAIGVGLPALTAMTAETANAQNSDRAISWMGAGYPVGAILGGAIAAYLLQWYSWRSIFVLGGVVTSTVLVLVLLYTTETVAYLERRASKDALHRVNEALRTLGKPMVEVLALPAPTRAATAPARRLPPRRILLVALPLIAAYWMHMCTFYFTLKWLPKIVTDMGYDSTYAATGLIMANFGGALGSILLGFLVARIGLKRITVIVMLASTVALWVLGASGGSIWQLIGAAVMACFFANAGVVGFYAIMASSFNAEWRGTGTGLVIGIGRGLSALAPILTGILFQAGLSLQLVASVIGSCSIVAAAFILIVPVGLRETGSETR